MLTNRACNACVHTSQNQWTDRQTIIPMMGNMTFSDRNTMITSIAAVIWNIFSGIANIEPVINAKWDYDHSAFFRYWLLYLHKVRKLAVFGDDSVFHEIQVLRSIDGKLYTLKTTNNLLVDVNFGRFMECALNSAFFLSRYNCAFFIGMFGWHWRHKPQIKNNTQFDNRSMTNCFVNFRALLIAACAVVP